MHNICIARRTFELFNMKAIQAFFISLFLNAAFCLPGCSNERQTHPCDENSVYCYTFGSEVPNLCVCLEGYKEYEKSGNNAIKCKDIDECATRTKCKPTFDCVNTIGSYHCACAEGSLEISGRCEKCDHKSPCGRNSTYCKGKMGPCVCTKGFKSTEPRAGQELNCEDIDECVALTSPCAASMQCINTVGSYKCECKPGYRMNALGTCQDIDECTEHKPCKAGHICVNDEGSYYCKTLSTAKPTDRQTKSDTVKHTDSQGEITPDFRAEEISRGSLLDLGRTTVWFLLTTYYVVM